MKWTTISAIIGTVLLVTALTLKLAGYEKEVFAEAKVSEPNEFVGLDIDWEPDYPIDLKLSGEDLGEGVTFSLGGDNEIVCDGTREKYLNILYTSLSGKEPTEKVTLRFEEPNEPKPDTTTLVGGIKKLAELIEYYHER